VRTSRRSLNAFPTTGSGAFSREYLRIYDGTMFLEGTQPKNRRTSTLIVTRWSLNQLRLRPKLGKSLNFARCADGEAQN
jgi:hypothetical protein